MSASSESVPSLALLFAVLLWGTTFVLVKETLVSTDALSLVAVRFAIASAILFGFFLLKKEKFDRETIRDGFSLGVLLFLGFSTQTIGLNYTTPSKSAFITGLCVVFVPILMTFLGKRIRVRDWAAALVAFAGLALLTYKPDFAFNPGDLLTLACAVFFGLHILFTGEFVKKRDFLKLTAVQLGAVAVLAIPLAVFSGPRVGSESFPAILFLALFPTLLSYLIMPWAQKRISQVRTGVIMSIEPVFAAVFSYIIIGEQFSLIQLFGSGLIFGAILMVSAKIKSAGAGCLGENGQPTAKSLHNL